MDFNLKEKIALDIYYTTLIHIHSILFTCKIKLNKKNE